MEISHINYIRREAFIGATISLVISVLFMFVVFTPTSEVKLGGFDGLLFDALPQSAGISFMCVLVSTLLTRKRIHSGVITPIAFRIGWLPQHLVIRSLLIAVIVACVMLAIHVAFASVFLSASSVQFMLALLYKAVYGFILGFGVAAFALKQALIVPK